MVPTRPILMINFNRYIQSSSSFHGTIVNKQCVLNDQNFGYQWPVCPRTLQTKLAGMQHQNVNFPVHILLP